MTVQLNLLSFDAPGATVADWLQIWLGQQSEGAGVWLLLEQMHRFDFAGPDREVISGIIAADSIGTYGLRGRLFWDTGQIEWRRLDEHRFRVVAVTEHSSPPVAPDGVDSLSEVFSVDPVDARLILWGRSRGKQDGGRFRELRVAGSGWLDYPKSLEQAAGTESEPVYSTLPIRSYRDDRGRERFRRFMPPAVFSQKELLKQEV